MENNQGGFFSNYNFPLKKFLRRDDETNPFRLIRKKKNQQFSSSSSSTLAEIHQDNSPSTYQHTINNLLVEHPSTFQQQYDPAQIFLVLDSDEENEAHKAIAPNIASYNTTQLLDTNKPHNQNNVQQMTSSTANNEQHQSVYLDQNQLVNSHGAKKPVQQIPLEANSNNNHLMPTFNNVHSTKSSSVKAVVKRQRLQQDPFYPSSATSQQGPRYFPVFYSRERKKKIQNELPSPIQGSIAPDTNHLNNANKKGEQSMNSINLTAKKSSELAPTTSQSKEEGNPPALSLMETHDLSNAVFKLKPLTINVSKIKMSAEEQQKTLEDLSALDLFSKMKGDGKRATPLKRKLTRVPVNKNQVSIPKKSRASKRIKKTLDESTTVKDDVEKVTTLSQSFLVTCSNCDSTFTKEAFEKHFCEFDDNKRLIPNAENYTFNNNDNLKTVYFCSLCGECFDNELLIWEHFKNNHMRSINHEMFIKFSTNELQMEMVYKEPCTSKQADKKQKILEEMHVQANIFPYDEFTRKIFVVRLHNCKFCRSKFASDKSFRLHNCEHSQNVFKNNFSNEIDMPSLFDQDDVPVKKRRLMKKDSNKIAPKADKISMLRLGICDVVGCNAKSYIGRCKQHYDEYDRVFKEEHSKINIKCHREECYEPVSCERDHGNCCEYHYGTNPKLSREAYSFHELNTIAEQIKDTSIASHVANKTHIYIGITSDIKKRTNVHTHTSGCSDMNVIFEAKDFNEALIMEAILVHKCLTSGDLEVRKYLTNCAGGGFASNHKNNCSYVVYISFDRSGVKRPGTSKDCVPFGIGSIRNQDQIYEISDLLLNKLKGKVTSQQNTKFKIGITSNMESRMHYYNYKYNYKFEHVNVEDYKNCILASSGDIFRTTRGEITLQSEDIRLLELHILFRLKYEKHGLLSELVLNKAPGGEIGLGKMTNDYFLYVRFWKANSVEEKEEKEKKDVETHDKDYYSGEIPRNAQGLIMWSKLIRKENIFKILNWEMKQSTRNFVDFRCEFCDTRFASKMNLKRHVLRCLPAGGKKTFVKCDLCECRYGSAHDLKRHKRKAHGKATMSRLQKSHMNSSKVKARQAALYDIELLNDHEEKEVEKFNFSNALEINERAFTEMYDKTSIGKNADNLMQQTTPIIAPRPMMSQKKSNPFAKKPNDKTTASLAALNHLTKESIGYNDSVTNSDDENVPLNNSSLINIKSISKDTPRSGTTPAAAAMPLNKRKLEMNDKGGASKLAKYEFSE